MAKYTLPSTLFAVFLILCSGVAMAQEVTTNQNTYMRDEASSSGKVVLKLQKGLELSPLMISPTSGWMPVLFKNLVGWVEGKHVFRSTVETYWGSGTEYLVVTRERAQMRGNPSRTGRRVLAFPKGTKFRTAEIHPVKGWHSVTLLYGVKGWISADDVRVDVIP